MLFIRIKLLTFRPVDVYNTNPLVMSGVHTDLHAFFIRTNSSDEHIGHAEGTFATAPLGFITLDSVSIALCALSYSLLLL